MAMPMFTLVNELAPALFSIKGDSGVLDARMQVNHLHDHVELLVAHKIISRRELDDGSYRRLAMPRIAKALLVDEDRATAKRDRVQRRQLLARGREARASKPRKIEV